MNKTVLIGLGIGVAATVGFVLYKGTELKETAGNINVTLLKLPQIHKIDLSRLKISVDLKVDNPAKARVSLKLPSVRLFYKGKLVASTAISDKTFTIEPVTTGKISGIMIEASFLNLASSAPTMVTDFIAQGTKITDNFGFDVIAEVNGLPLRVQKL